MVITTKIAINGLQLINKLGIKKELLDFMSMSAKAQGRIDNLYKEIFVAEGLIEKEEYTDADVDKALAKQSDKAKEIENIKAEVEGVGLDLILTTLIERVPNCEKDFYKFITLVSGKTEKQVSELDIAEVVEIVREVFMSESFKSFFSVMNK